MKNIDFKYHLDIDLTTYKKHIATPVCHKIAFDKSTIYLTKSTFYKLESGKNGHGDYRIFSWVDIRAKAFLGFELGDVSPKLGTAQTIGVFTPSEQDLINVQYSSGEGKAFYPSATFEMINRNDFTKINKRKSDNIFKLDEVIPNGAQGKAILANGNYIISGPAGTGKSTTVLQKIKLLQVQENISPNEITIITKHEGVISDFNELLDKMSISGQSISTIKHHLEKHYKSYHSLKDSDISSAREIANNIYRTILLLKTDVANFKKIKNINLISLSELKITVDNKLKHPRVNYLIEQYISKRSELYNIKEACQKELSDIHERYSLFQSLTKELLLVRGDDKNKLKDVLSRYSNELSNTQITLIGSKVSKYLRDSPTNSNLESPTQQFKSEEIKNAETIQKKFNDILNVNISNLEVNIETIVDLFLSNTFCEFAFHSDEMSQFLRMYISKLLGKNLPYHTSIIDEAQDISLRDIELCYILSKNTILTGDELQCENKLGLGEWPKLNHLLNEFSTADGKLKLYNLSHNFRQSYELGNCSINYRNILLKQPLLDYKEEYYDFQKGFKKPSLHIIDNDREFIKIISDTHQNIADVFDKQFPVSVVFFTEEHLLYMKSILEQENISFDINDTLTTTVSFVNANEMAGKSYPHLVSFIPNEITQQQMYILLTRAKFELTLYAYTNDAIKHELDILIKNGFLELYNTNVNHISHISKQENINYTKDEKYKTSLNQKDLLIIEETIMEQIKLISSKNIDIILHATKNNKEMLRLDAKYMIEILSKIISMCE